MKEWNLEEERKCCESFVYFYNNHFNPVDKDGNPIPKRKLTEEQFEEIQKYYAREYKGRGRTGFNSTTYKTWFDDFIDELKNGKITIK